MSESTNPHTSVMLAEAIEALEIKPGGIYIDATYGRGGHAKEIWRRLNDEGKLMVFDRDPAAIASIPEEMKRDQRFFFENLPFSTLKQVVSEKNWQGQILGILLDLGVSSPQLDNAERGFSFLKEGPLDMRMDPQSGLSAADWINQASEKEIAEVLKIYGEERHARRIAQAIVRARELKAILTTRQLAEIVSAANPAWEKHKHPATRAFQAIRIFINRELAELETALEQSVSLLAKGGRLVVISFHSLEDRIVKQFIRNMSREKHLPWPEFINSPDIASANIQLKKIGKARFPTDLEMKKNPRSRSAVLRIAEKI